MGPYNLPVGSMLPIIQDLAYEVEILILLMLWRKNRSFQRENSSWVALCCRHCCGEIGYWRRDRSMRARQSDATTSASSLPQHAHYLSRITRDSVGADFLVSFPDLLSATPTSFQGCLSGLLHLVSQRHRSASPQRAEASSRHYPHQVSGTIYPTSCHCHFGRSFSWPKSPNGMSGKCPPDSSLSRPLLKLFFASAAWLLVAVWGAVFGCQTGSAWAIIGAP